MFSVPSDSLTFAQSVFDDMLNNWDGKPCQLFYAETQQVCPNCIINPATRVSTNRYNGTGPQPFPTGQTCPVCNGRGFIINTAKSDTITMAVDWTPKPWMNVGPAGGTVLRVPGGMVTSRGFVTDLPKVIRADYAFLDTSNTTITNRFKLYGKPFVSGATVTNRYFMAIWQRAES